MPFDWSKVSNDRRVGYADEQRAAQVVPIVPYGTSPIMSALPKIRAENERRRAELRK